jgi:hypothetical protein
MGSWSLLSRLMPAACLVLAAAPALAVEIEPLPDGKARALLGDIRLYHDPAEWRIEGEDGAFAVHCRGLECEAPLMSIIAVPDELTSCSPGAVIDRSALDYPEAWTREASHSAAIGLTVNVATLDQGCRNWAGSPVYACTSHNGLTWWFLAPGEQCRTSVTTSAALEALLNGLSAAEPAAP